ncbi:MAG: hypothetical protein HZC42_09920 [Candidatus Eisenbacteria bacterium]|nr:hypothetical protein [Candidatus Eisenbacteria bacterium]
MHNLRYLIPAALLLAGIPLESRAAGVTIESFSTMSAFQSSAFYSYATGGAGLTGRKATGVRGVRQGPSDVPAASAGAANNTTVTTEVLTAAKDVPDVFSLSSTASYYDKKFVSVGTSTSSTNPPYITLDLTPVATASAGGYSGGYDIAVFDLGKNLATGTGNQNTEATIFDVELVSEGVFYNVGTITATGGNFINVILLNVTGITGIPAYIDAIKITDVTGSGTSASGGLDVDGALTLNVYTATAAVPTSWGRLKVLYK